MEGTDVSYFYVHEQAGGMYLARITEGIGVDGSKAIKLQSSDNEANSWDTQFDMRLPYVLPAGTQYKLSFDYKSDKKAVRVSNDEDYSFGFQLSNEPGQYVWWTLGGWPAPSLSVSESDVNKWLHFEETDACDGVTKSDQGDWLLKFRTIYINLAGNKVAKKFIIDNVKVEIKTSVLASLTAEPVTDPTLMIPYYDDDDVAVGKLEAAIETYNVIASPTDADKATLKAAIDQFKADNAYQEKDVTAKVGTDTDSWSVAPLNDSHKATYSHNNITLIEHFGDTTPGDKIWQTVDVTNGTYNIELYATSHNAWEGQYMPVAGDNPAPTLQGGCQ